MLTAHWGIAAWADNPELPPTRWETLEVVPPGQYEPAWKLSERLGRINADLSGRFTPNQFGGPSFFYKMKQRAL
jgi:hypothetical protein